LFEVLTQQSDGGANINFTILTEPNEIKMLQNDKKLRSKLVLLMFKICNFEYGRKNTGGYSITIESVVETDKKYNYKCQRERSAPNSMVTQGITIRFVLSKLILKKELDKKSHSSYFFCTNSLILELVLKTECYIENAQRH
jgi:hypothetical protein